MKTKLLFAAVIAISIFVTADSASAQTPQSGRIWGRVWLDTNGDRYVGSGESYVRDPASSCASNATVALAGSITISGGGLMNPLTVSPSLCSGDGTFPYFDSGPNLAPGTYQVSIVPPSGWALTTSANYSVNVTSGANAPVQFIGLKRLTGRIWGRVWQDTNGDQNFGSGELYIRDPANTGCNATTNVPLTVSVTVSGGGLTNPLTVSPSLCSGDGTFPYFDSGMVIAPGDYQVTITPSSGTMTTPQIQTVTVTSAISPPILLVGVKNVPPPPPPPPPPVFDQLKNVNWKYSRIFVPEDIPLPDSAKNVFDARVVSVYSPSVTKFQNRYVMFFGVAVYCRGNTVARDSIAMADSDDGITWKFNKYIVEPDPQSCTSGFSGLANGSTYQINDPYIFVQDESLEQGKILRAMYTSVLAPVDNCGFIGIAAFDANFNLLYRNDRYAPEVQTCTAETSHSRPALQWLDRFATRLWFDKNGYVRSAPVTSLTPLAGDQSRDEGAEAVDVDLPRLSYAETLLLQSAYGGNGITARSRRVNETTWSPIWQVTSLSGQSWDTWRHGSPDLQLDTSSCKPTLYFSGFSEGSNNLPIGSIAVAVPPYSKTFSFPVCSKLTSSPMPDAIAVPPSNSLPPSLYSAGGIGNSGSATTLPAPAATGTCFDLKNNLRQGSRDRTSNGEASLLQNFLGIQRYFNQKSTGFFGPITLNAVKIFQRDNSIIQTGFVGPITRAKIKELSCP